MYMVRKQLYIDDRHERDLKRRATALGVSEAELVRRALDLALQGDAPRPALHPEREEAVRRLRKRWSVPSATLVGGVERDDLYADRLGRLGRREVGADEA